MGADPEAIDLRQRRSFVVLFHRTQRHLHFTSGETTTKHFFYLSTSYLSKIDIWSKHFFLLLTANDMKDRRTAQPS
jgi:hypothetical protein